MLLINHLLNILFDKSLFPFKILEFKNLKLIIREPG